MVSGLSTENLLSAILEALAEPTVSYIGLGYDSTVSLNTSNSHNKIFPHTLHDSLLIAQAKNLSTVCMFDVHLFSSLQLGARSTISHSL